MARRGVTQTTLAGLLGLSQVAVSSRLRGVTAWRVSEIVAVADFLEVSVEHLLGRTA